MSEGRLITVSLAVVSAVVLDGGILDGRTLADAGIRAETGVAVIAVQAGEETHSNPEFDFEMLAGDVLVAVGTRAE